MFTGIIETIGKITRKNVTTKNIIISVQPALKDFLSDIHKGSSIALNGACLTVSEFKPGEFTAFIATETYNITNLKSLHTGDKVNLEKALKLGDRLDGHFVTGHIDDTAIVTGIHKINQDFSLAIRIKPSLLKYIIIKGSMAINGISLTIAKISSDILSFSIIPETYKNTNIPELKIRDKVNIEVELFAKYMENFNSIPSSANPASGVNRY